AGRNIDQIHARFLIAFGKFNAMIEIVSAVSVFHSGNSDDKWHVLRYDGLDRFDYPDSEQSIVLSVFILSFISKWGLELVDQIAVGSVNFNRVKPCLDSTHRPPFIGI